MTKTGSGITHSDFNPSAVKPTHFHQIWLLPERTGIVPGYEQKQFDSSGRKNQLQLVASRDATDGSLLIHQDTKVYLAELTNGQDLT